MGGAGAMMAASRNLVQDQLLALFLSSATPLTREQLAAVFVAEEDGGDWEAALQGLLVQGSGPLVLREVAGGYQLHIHPRYTPCLLRLHAQGPRRLSRAVLETLAVIAYRQPITRPEIEQWRGVTLGAQVLRQLQERGWIDVVGHRDTPGRPALWATTDAFLAYFALPTLGALPELEVIRDEKAGALSSSAKVAE
jgi:segregation and condensation protein B